MVGTDLAKLLRFKACAKKGRRQLAITDDISPLSKYQTYFCCTLESITTRGNEELFAWSFEPS